MEYKILIILTLFVQHSFGQINEIKVSFSEKDEISFTYLNEFDVNVMSSSLSQNTIDGYISKTIYSRTPILIYLNKGFKLYTALALPGDSVFIGKTLDETFHFTINSNLTGILNEIENKYGLLQPSPEAGMDIDFENFMIQIKDKKLNRLSMLADMDSSNSDRIYLIKRIIEYKYLLELLSPFYRISLEEIDMIRLLPKSYFDEIEKTFSLISDDNYFTISIFKISMLNYLKYRCAVYDSNLINTENLYNSINKHISNPYLKDYLYFRVLSKGNDLGSLDSSFRLKYYSEFQPSNYTEYLKEITLNKNDFLNNSKVRSTMLLNASGQKISFADIIAKHTGKTILLDFWATWCLPCLLDHKVIVEHSDELMINNCVVINISLDSDTTKWKNHKNFFGESYLLTNNSDLALFLAVPPVPRYIIINNNLDVIDMKAPNPYFNKELFEIIKRINK